MSRDERNEQRAHMIGWILFVICAIFFILGSVKNKDLISLIASLLFFVACFFFMVPLVRKMMKDGED